MRVSVLLSGLLVLPVVAAPAKKAPANKAPAKKAPAKAPVKTTAPAPAKPAEPQDLNLGGVSGTLPGAWASQPPIGQFRLAQYALPKATGDAADSLLIVFHFGKGGGGSVEDNVQRWLGMMAQPEGTDVRTVAKRATKERTGLRITTLELPGTYQEKPFPFSQEVKQRPNYRMLAAIVETTTEAGEGPFYLRIVGPTKSVEAAKPGWDALIDSLKAQ